MNTENTKNARLSVVGLASIGGKNYKNALFVVDRRKKLNESLNIISFLKECSLISKLFLRYSSNEKIITSYYELVHIVEL